MYFVCYVGVYVMPAEEPRIAENKINKQQSTINFFQYEKLYVYTRAFAYRVNIRHHTYAINAIPLFCMSAYIKYIDKILFLIENRITSKPNETYTYTHAHTTNGSEREKERQRNLPTSMPYSSHMWAQEYSAHITTPSTISFSHSVDWPWHCLLLAHSLPWFYSAHTLPEKKCVRNIIFANLKNRSMWVI